MCFCFKTRRPLSARGVKCTSTRSPPVPITWGCFVRDIGQPTPAGLSPTEREFDQATASGRPRLIFIKGANDPGREPRMRGLIGKAGRQLVRRRFTGVSDLNASLYASLVEHLERTGRLRTRPFDA